MPVSRRSNKEEKEERVHQERCGLHTCTHPLGFERWQKEWQEAAKSLLCQGSRAEALPCAGSEPGGPAGRVRPICCALPLSRAEISSGDKGHRAPKGAQDPSLVFREKAELPPL